MPVIRVPITIRDLTAGDLPALQWSGSAAHIKSVRRQLDRVASGAVEYLVACMPSGSTVGKVGIDYDPHPDAGVLWQAAVHGALQSCGIGTLLVAEAERRILARGRRRAELLVEHSNPRARALYERLGYAAYGDQQEEWDEQGPDGEIVRYRNTCAAMRKPLACAGI